MDHSLILPFEERPVLHAPVKALDRHRFDDYLRTRYGEEDAAPDEVRVRRMQNLKLLGADEGGTLHPTGLGLLMFCGEADRWISGAYVDIVAYAGLVADANEQRDAKVIHGTLIEQLEGTLRFLQQSPFLPVAATKDGTGRRDQPAYSMRAVQEAVVNALVHRDYALTGSQVRVFLFPDRIEVANPGGLHNTLHPEDLFAGCQPHRRNQMLAGFLRDYTSPITQRAYMEARGEGFLTLVRECERISGRRPELALIGGGVRLTLFAGPPPA